jgi:hypothetical protein
MLALSPQSTSRASIFALYGQDASKTGHGTPPKRSTAQSSADIPILGSESEKEEPAQLSFVQFLDSANMALIRRLADDSEICATMRPGAGGFMEGFFGDDGPHPTEIPNAIYAAAESKGGMPAISDAWRKDVLETVNANKAKVKDKGKKSKAKTKAKVRAKPAAATVSEKNVSDQESECDSHSVPPTELYEAEADGSEVPVFAQYGLETAPPVILRRQPVEIQQVQLKLTCASDKTYILYKPKSANKFVLMVNCTKGTAASSSKNHNEVIVVGVWDRFVKDKCVPTKEKAIEFRDFYLNS